jgi:alpha-galactosidase
MWRTGLLPQLDNLRYMLRSGMMGWFSLMLDATRWTPEERKSAMQEFALYKSALRPLIRAADLYHVSSRPDGVHWDGIEYFSAQRQSGVLYAFRGTVPDESSHRFRLKGLDPDRQYRVNFQDRGPAAGQRLSGQALMQEGIEVFLPNPLSSELVFLTTAP